jgi:hypothetical protein
MFNINHVGPGIVIGHFWMATCATLLFQDFYSKLIARLYFVVEPDDFWSTQVIHQVKKFPYFLTLMCITSFCKDKL